VRDADGTRPRARAVPEDGRVAVVSGGDEGVGPQVVRRLAALGLRVVLGCRSVERGRLVIDDLGELADRVAVRQLDVTDPDSGARLAAWVSHRLGRCDVLVSNLALRLHERSGTQQVDLGTVRHELWSNLDGTRQLARRLAPLMRACGYGRVVTVLAGDVLPVGPILTAHRMSRSALHALTTVLPEDLGDDSILANAYCRPLADADAATAPGTAVDTAVWLATLPDDGPTGRPYG